MKELLPTIVCNTTAAKEHVAEAERNIRVAKKRNRGAVNTLPFTYIPRRIKNEFIYFVTLWFNAFPVKSGVSETFSFKHIKRVLQVYDRAGFTVRYVMIDGEFEKVKELLLTIVCNTTSAKEHVA